MIYYGSLPVTFGQPQKVGPREVVVELVLDTSKFVYEITRVVRAMIRRDFAVDVRGLNEHQVDALLYVRGGFDPDFADDAARDQYLKIIAGHPRVGSTAAAAFLRGWATRRPGADDPIDPFTWHRYMAGTELRVSAA